MNRYILKYKKFLDLDEKLSKIYNIRSINTTINYYNNIFIGNYNCNIPTLKHKNIIKDILFELPKNDNKYKMILDVETNGYNNIIQICYCIVDDNNVIIKDQNFLLFNNKYESDFYDKIKIDDIIKYGINPIILINKINDDLQHCNTIIGHNILFDIRKIYQYAEKFNMIFDYSNKKIVCTMKESRKYDIARDKNNRIKNPTLNELCGHFKIVPDKDKFHDASYDVFMTLQCYICLIKTKMINTK